MNNPQPSPIQNTLRIILGLFMLLAGIAHLTFQRIEFQSQVPYWVPFGKDFTVIASGIVEMALGLALIFWIKQRKAIGIALALFFVLVFPGNVAQYADHRNAFGLDTDGKRLARLYFQPVLILWALWSSGALQFSKRK